MAKKKEALINTEVRLIKRCADSYGSMSGRYSNTKLEDLISNIKHGVPNEYVDSIVLSLDVEYSYGDTDGTPKLMAYYYSPETKEEELARITQEEKAAKDRKAWDLLILDEIANRHGIKVIK